MYVWSVAFADTCVVERVCLGTTFCQIIPPATNINTTAVER